MTAPPTPAARWLFDLGNTRLKWARADQLASCGATALAYDLDLDLSAAAAAWADVREGDEAWLASVGPAAATARLASALGRRGVRTIRASTRPALAGVRIAYADPAKLGVDRFLALLGARARAHRAWLIVGVGTALTIDLLGADGIHHGGLIAPSPTLMRQSLSQRAPHLPGAGGHVVDFADDTLAALASGTTLAARALVARSRHAARRRLGVSPSLLVAGGGAQALLDGWKVQASLATDLVLEGLAVYAAEGAGIAMP